MTTTETPVIVKRRKQWTKKDNTPVLIERIKTLEDTNKYLKERVTLLDGMLASAIKGWSSHLDKSRVN